MRANGSSLREPDRAGRRASACAVWTKRALKAVRGRLETVLVAGFVVSVAFFFAFMACLLRGQLMRRSFIIVGGVSRRRSVFASSAGGGRCSGIAGCSGTGRRGPIMGVATITRSRNRRRAAPRPVRFRPRAGFRRGMAPPMPARRQPAGGDAGQGAEGRRILRRRQAARAGGPWAPRVRRAGGGPGARAPRGFVRAARGRRGRRGRRGTFPHRCRAGRAMRPPLAPDGRRTAGRRTCRDG